MMLFFKFYLRICDINYCQQKMTQMEVIIDWYIAVWDNNIWHNKIFSGYHSHQMVEWRKNKHFEDHLRPQGTEVAGVPIHVIYTPARAPCLWPRASQWGLVGLWFHVEPGLLSCYKHAIQSESWVKQGEHLTPPTSPHWLARSHEHGARAGIYMTRMGTPPFQYSEDEDGDGPRNVCFFAIQPFDAGGSLRRFYYT
jgi:hypothetical protein